MKFEKLASINDEALRIAGSIKVLEPLSWAKHLEQDFLKSWHLKKNWDPVIEYPEVDYSEQRTALEKLSRKVRGDHPLEVFTLRTVDSYIQATHLVEALGTKNVQTFSEEIFGKPTNKIPGTNVTNLDAARRLISITQSFIHPYIKEPALNVTADEMAEFLSSKISNKMRDKGPQVVITPELSAKAAASSRTIKLRQGTTYSHYDFDQLYEHEIMIHSLTALNGQNQKILKSMGRGSPRTTLTQEGLATFAEVITGAIDLRRLNRLALRIEAIYYALEGANFQETFEYFLSHGQTEKESFWSAARIFRGGFPHKDYIFTKDTVYLDGLIKVQTLFKWALAQGHLGITHLLFCGRLAIEDLFLLKSCFDEKLIDPPEFFPDWYEKIEGFAGKLSFTFLTHEFEFEHIESYYNEQIESFY